MDNPMAAFQVEGMTKWGRNNVFGQVKHCGCYQIIASPEEEGIDVGNKNYCIERSGERKGNGDTIPEKPASHLPPTDKTEKYYTV